MARPELTCKACVFAQFHQGGALHGLTTCVHPAHNKCVGWLQGYGIVVQDEVCDHFSSPAANTFAGPSPQCPDDL